jgi:hypothetical protein
MESDADLGLKTLLDVRNEVAVNVDADVLSACYQIQKKYQFEHDRSLSVQATERLIDSIVDRAATAEGE